MASFGLRVSPTRPAGILPVARITQCKMQPMPTFDDQGAYIQPQSNLEIVTIYGPFKPTPRSFMDRLSLRVIYRLTASDGTQIELDNLSSALVVNDEKFPITFKHPADRPASVELQNLHVYFPTMADIVRVTYQTKTYIAAQVNDSWQLTDSEGLLLARCSPNWKDADPTTKMVAEIVQYRPLPPLLLAALTGIKLGIWYRHVSGD